MQSVETEDWVEPEAKKPKLSGDPNEVTVVATLSFRVCLRGDGAVGWESDVRLATPLGEVYDDDEPTLSTRGVFNADHCFKAVEASANDTLKIFTRQAVDLLQVKSDREGNCCKK